MGSTAVGGDALDRDFEMIRVQRKRAPTNPTVNAEDARASGGERSAWHVVANAGDSSNDDSHCDDDDDFADRNTKATKATRSQAHVGTLGTGTQPLGRLRRWLVAVVSAQLAVALGILWCAVVAAILVKWLWFYQSVVQPLEKWLGPKNKAESEPMIVGLVLIAPFVATGVMFYTFRPPSPRLDRLDTPTGIMEKLRMWRRDAFGGRLDSNDVVALVVFAIVQVSALVGKLLIDQYNGKLATSGYLIRTGRALGMNGFYAVLFSIALVSRQSFVHEFLNLSSERAAKYHVWSGNFGVAALALHGFIYSYCWYVEDKLAKSLIPCFDCDDKTAYKSLRNFSGLVAQVLLLAVAAASLERTRRRHFRRFTLVHCLNVLFVVGTCVHYYPAVYWFTAPLLIYVMYRIISVFTRARSGVVSARALDDSIVQLQLRRDCVGLGREDFVPGQYVYLKVDELSKNEWHPFTISSSPLRDQVTLSLDIKVQGLFTTRLLHLVRTGSLANVQIDGYYGTGIDISTDMILVAGGSGMTPFLSLLEHFVVASQLEDVPGRLPQRLWIVWTARDISLLNAHMPLLDQVHRSSVWKSRMWIHWTGAGNMQDEDALEGVGRRALGDKFATSHHAGSSATPEVSDTVVFTATVAGAVLGTALVFMSPLLYSFWWVKRVSLLMANVLGAMGGASTILWRAVPSRAGFERLETSDIDMAVTPIKLAQSSGGDSSTDGTPGSIAIRRSRPAIDTILHEVHASCRAEGVTDVRVVVSGPSGLQHSVVDVSCALRSPLVSVECRSFAL